MKHVIFHVVVAVILSVLIQFNWPIHWMPGARASHPFWLPALWANNLENGVIPSYINDEIKIVAIQKSVLYNDGNLVVILSAFFSQKIDGEKRLCRFCKRYL